MAKKPQQPVKRHYSKHQVAKFESQKKRQRIIFATGLSVIGIVLVLVGMGVYKGWYVDQYKPMHTVVLTVGDTKYNVSYFVDALKHFTGGDSTYAYYFIDAVAERIQLNQLIVEKAAEMGYTVSEDEIDASIEENSLDDVPAVRDIVRASLLISTLKTEYFDPQVPQNAEQREALAMLLESESAASEVLAGITTDEEFAAKAAELSLESNTKTDEGTIDFRPANTISSLYGSEILEQYIFSTDSYDYTLLQDADVSKQRAYWLIEVLERNADSGQIHALGMLLPSQEVALEVKAKLEAGEDWGDLAVEYSQLANVEDNRGDMDWISSTSVPENVADIIFADDAELNTVLDPIQDGTNTTRGGCWIVRLKSVDENRELSEDDRTLLINDKVDEWTTDLKNANLDRLTNTFSDDLITFAIDQLD
ncbi:MAG: peptidylprolyl isomerase [Dehalococcoides mccartyi]|uniref:peptidylprolyl isomerase n=1 Tax=Dehalococcoides TaxID=61434 RepID=UPI001A105799|nr:peptidylprolyl isomerase [Dehalococcoides mccartyi]MBF4482183.1 peptidylprolyl isomerase [Dehalococcoides mccartyi]MBJ7531761.1 peptidylprolyl isomerase [Dehalococcoides mccartyi]MDP4279169.1 peptidylprolyl isomerase [Dehalococcoides mccartyi]